jgi:hypothetical protein
MSIQPGLFECPRTTENPKAIFASKPRVARNELPWVELKPRRGCLFIDSRPRIAQPARGFLLACQDENCPAMAALVGSLGSLRPTNQYFIRWPSGHFGRQRRRRLAPDL